jgi:hypothetical protein
MADMRTIVNDLNCMPWPATGSGSHMLDGRILIGFHFRHADVNGAWIGKKAAQWVDKYEFAPIR